MKEHKQIEIGVFKNPEWQKFKAKEFRMPNQFGKTETALDYAPVQVTVFQRVKNVLKRGGDK